MKDNRCILITTLKQKIRHNPDIGTYVSEEDIDLSPRVFCSYEDDKFDFSECQKGLHRFKIITKRDFGDEELAVRWCPQCGAIVVDREFDGRLDPGYYQKLKYPEITEKYGLK